MINFFLAATELSLIAPILKSMFGCYLARCSAGNLSNLKIVREQDMLSFKDILKTV